jgi:oligopeptide/dipeptide ABC transporter ATP-binding protein
LHPYTAALLQARPEIDRRVDRLPAIPGHPTSAYEAPVGCPFAPRCRFAQNECRTQTPPLIQVAQGLTRCRRMPELRGQLFETVEVVEEEAQA